MTRLFLRGRTIVLATAIALSLAAAPVALKELYSPSEKAFYAEDATVQFVRPGLVIKITSAQIAADGTITATISITDPQGLPLDRTGIFTPGAVSLSLVAATIPKGETEYVAYTTRTQRSTITGNSAIQAAADAGGTFTQVGDGVYQYRFVTRALSGFDALATHTIGAYGSRDLSLFDLEGDVAETTNVAADHPEVVKLLQQLAEKARRDLGDGKVEGTGVRPAGMLATAPVQ